jgi:hypothetical protein
MPPGYVSWGLFLFSSELLVLKCIYPRPAAIKNTEMKPGNQYKTICWKSFSSKKCISLVLDE